MGQIEVITGPMFAGKSEELLRRIRRLEYAKKNFCVFKPAIDNRYSDNELVSHLKNKSKAIVINNAKEILKYINKEVEFIIIDEAQFLDLELVEICETLANNGKKIIISGLDMDFRGEPFPVMAALLCKAENIVKLTAICVKCGNLATKSQKIINNKPAKYNDPIITIGANEKYEPRCRKCHKINK